MSRRGVFVKGEGAPLLNDRQRDALRACALGRGGLRREAYPSIMPVLVQLGLVEERLTRGRPARALWHLTPAGRGLLKTLGARDLD